MRCSIKQTTHVSSTVEPLQDVVEFELHIAPCDVHRKGKAWVVNSKVKKNAEVCVRKLHRDEQVEFEQATKKEIDSFVSQDAVQSCSSKGISRSRVMQMRWVHVRKPLLNDSGVQEGRKAKARLIIKGFQDPRLTHLPRESPTLATLGRNMLLTQCARRQFQLSSGDISTAFLQGNQLTKIFLGAHLLKFVRC